jgi:hypothetical protein
MTEGEKLVWAAAFVEKYKALEDPLLTFISRDASYAECRKATEKITVNAAKFADEVVNAMTVAQKLLRKGTDRKTRAYARLNEMLK